MKRRIDEERESVREMAKKFNVLLASYHILYINLKGMYWTFEKDISTDRKDALDRFYKDILLIIDIIAERIIGMEYQPLHTYSDYIGLSKINQDRNICTYKAASMSIIKALNTLEVLEKEIEEQAKINEDTESRILIKHIIKFFDKSVFKTSLKPTKK